MAIVDLYRDGDLTQVIVDILNAAWPAPIKRHLLVKELLWNQNYPRAIHGSIRKEFPKFSNNALEQWENNIAAKVKPRKGLVLEHAIPRIILYEELLKQKPDFNSVLEFQKQFIHRAYVTKAEDRLLDSKGLRSHMPPDWDGKDVWARHTAVGIVHAERLPAEFEYLDEEEQQDER